MRLSTRFVVAALSVLFSLQAVTHAQVAPSMKVLRLTSALDQLVAPGAEHRLQVDAHIFRQHSLGEAEQSIYLRLLSLRTWMRLPSARKAITPAILVSQTNCIALAPG